MHVAAMEHVHGAGDVSRAVHAAMPLAGCRAWVCAMVCAAAPVGGPASGRRGAQ